MSAPTLAVERTALAWRRTALGAAACALLFTDQVLREGWGPLAVVSLCALVTALLRMPYRTLLGVSGGSSLYCHGWTDATLTAAYDHTKNPDRHRYLIPSAIATFTTVPS